MLLLTKQCTVSKEALIDLLEAEGEGKCKQQVTISLESTFYFSKTALPFQSKWNANQMRQFYYYHLRDIMSM